MEVRGSSPLVRGLRIESHHTAESEGIIPARAGFTRALGLRVSSGQDHPRSCGVYLRRVE